MKISESQAFIDAINANCAEPAPKMAFADWLQEKDTPEDQARADYIRASYYADAWDEKTGTVTDHQLKAAMLEQQYRNQWFNEADKALPDGFWCNRNAGFTHGVIDLVACDADTLLNLVNNTDSTGLSVPIHRLQVDGIRDEDTAVQVVNALEKLNISGLKIADWEYALPDPAAANSRTRMLQAIANTPAGQCLRHLDLSKNDIGCRDVEEVEAIGKAIKGISNLQQLDIQLNGLGTHASAFGKAIKDMPNLQQLNMGGNDISSDAPAFGEAIKHMPNLQQLDMGGNSIGSDAPAFGKAIKHMSSLQKLGMRYNNISSHAAAFGKTIKDMSSLRQLNMSKNNIGSHAPAFGKAIKHMSSLQKLDMGDNRISSDTTAFGKAIKDMSNLQQLNMWHNNIGSHASRFGEAIKNMPNLQQLNMGYNYISYYEEQIPALANALRASALHSVDFSDNYLAESSRAILRRALQPRTSVYARKGETMDVTRSDKQDMHLVF